MISLIDILDEAARAYPNRIALRYRSRAYTYRVLKGRVDRLAAALRSLGVGRGGFVSVISQNSSACVEIVLACARIGAVCEQYNTRISAESIARLLERSESTVVFMSRRLHGHVGRQLEAVSRPLHVVLLEGGPEGAFPSYETLIAASDPLTETAAIAPEDPAIMLFTSGTTGMPKGVLISHRALAARIEMDTHSLQLTGSETMLFVLPLFHVTSLTAYGILALGGQVVVLDSSRPESIVAALRRCRVTHVGLVPFLMRSLAAFVERSRISIDTLQLIIYGGEPAAPALLTRCRRLFRCGFFQGYGMTETTSAVFALLPEDHDDSTLLGTVGRALEGVEALLVDERGRCCGPGEKGEVVVKTDALMSGYYRDPARTGEALKRGWYRTGDIGLMDERGFLTLVDRKKNMVITGGENVYPAEVARCIQGMPQVADAIVLGVPDEYWGETLAAAVVRRGESRVSEQEIIKHCALRLGGYKKPRKVLFVDALPRSATGKVPRSFLDKLKRELG